MDGGTHLAGDRDVHGFEAWRGRRNSYFLEEAHLPTAVLLGASAVNVAILAILEHAGVAPWRLVTVAAVFAAFMVLQRLVMVRAREVRCVDHAFVVVSIGAQIFVVTSAALTG